MYAKLASVNILNGEKVLNEQAAAIANNGLDDTNRQEWGNERHSNPESATQGSGISGAIVKATPLNTP